MKTLNDRVAKLEQEQARGRTLVVIVDYEDRQVAEARARAETGYKGRYTDVINIHGGLPLDKPKPQ